MCGKCLFSLTYVKAARMCTCWLSCCEHQMSDRISLDLEVLRGVHESSMGSSGCKYSEHRVFGLYSNFFLLQLYILIFFSSITNNFSTTLAIPRNVGCWLCMILQYLCPSGSAYQLRYCYTWVRMHETEVHPSHVFCPVLWKRTAAFYPAEDH